MNEGLARIRRFSTFTWIFGTVVVAIIAAVVFPRIYVNQDTGDVYVENPDGGLLADYPWLVDDPQEYEIVDGVIHGTREGGFLRLPAGADLMMLRAAQGVDAADWISVHQQVGTVTDPDSDAWEYPHYVGAIWPDGELLVMPAGDDGLLWFSEALADWTVTVTTPDTTPMTGTYSGKGNAVLLYEGNALSGRFQHTGTGLFIVNAVTVGDYQLLVNEADEVDLRASWVTTDRVAFFVQADTGDGSWTITLDTPAGEQIPGDEQTDDGGSIDEGESEEQG